MRVLLDTHALLWWIEGKGHLSGPQARAIGRADPEHPLLVSDITLWEIAMLQTLGRIALELPLRDWLERAVAPPLVQRQGISPAIAAEVASLPESFHHDPADRILVATARVLGATLITSDRRILESKLAATVG